MAKILTDYQGRKIRLTDERRQRILAHPEMAEMEAAIELVLDSPEVVRRSSTDDAVYLYYRYHEGTSVGDKWLCVVITAYLTDKLKAGEQICPKA